MDKGIDAVQGEAERLARLIDVLGEPGFTPTSTPPVTAKLARPPAPARKAKHPRKKR